jgi:hypothetical protein
MTKYQRAMMLAKAVKYRKNKKLAIRKCLAAIKDMIG